VWFIKTLKHSFYRCSDVSFGFQRTPISEQYVFAIKIYIRVLTNWELKLQADRKTSTHICLYLMNTHKYKKTFDITSSLEIYGCLLDNCFNVFTPILHYISNCNMPHNSVSIVKWDLYEVTLNIFSLQNSWF